MSFRGLPGREGKYCCREIPLVTYSKRPQTRSNQVHEQMRTRQCTSKAITIAAVMKTIKVVDLDSILCTRPICIGIYLYCDSIQNKHVCKGCCHLNMVLRYVL